MDKKIAILSFKVLSIYAFIHAVDRLPDVFYYMIKNNVFDEFSIVYFVPNAVPLILITIGGILLWYGAPLLASSIFKSSLSEDKTEISLADIQVTAFSIIGLFIIVNSIFDVTQGSAINYMVGTSYDVSKPILVVRNIHFILFLVKMSLGLWLLFGSRGIVNFIRSTRRD